MKTLTHASIVALALAAGMPLAQAATPAAASGKSIVKTTCQDYLALDETI